MKRFLLWPQVSVLGTLFYTIAANLSVRLDLGWWSIAAFLAAGFLNYIVTTDWSQMLTEVMLDAMKRELETEKK